MPSDRLDGVALVTGGGRGIGASIARELADAGMRVAVTGRTREQVEAVAQEIGGLALVGDVSQRADVESWVGRTEAELGPIALLVANAGIGNQQGATWDGTRRGVVARARGQRPRRPSLLPERPPRDARARAGANRHHRQRRRLPPRHSRHRLPGEQGGGLQLRGGARCRARRTYPGLLLQPRARANGDDGAVRRQRAVDAARARAAARACARIGPRGCARGPLPPRRARRHRGPHRACGRIVANDLNAIRLRR